MNKAQNTSKKYSVKLPGDGLILADTSSSIVSEHEHIWQISFVQEQLQAGYTGTGMPIEYAYLLCQCGTVMKKIVNKS